MTVATPDMDLRSLYEILQGESGRAHLEARYPDEMSWYLSYSDKGFEHSFVQASLKAMWQQEMERDAGQSIRELQAAPA